MTLTKAELAENIFTLLGINKREATELVEIFFEEIKSLLENGHHVRLSGFGSFILRDKRERPGRNPRTGISVPVSARRVVTFHAGQKLRSRVERYGDTTKEALP